ncbi:helix-turn-helix domain-containing protein [Ellagibacter isourolithinifaciens]|uniref:helix-turn-helix domain-containing protein n=1 Tax=Ellagibacter isourolithinifaciens TaxID=2137581 RepID=UPI0023F1464B|nr:helix-turn-helix transcriptional regulator [Ellagibacter isourolithinifaciens]MDD5924970.1 helix-turn-helix transcriptional regulator [Ellagibacter isourolithinifaciens]
MLKALRELNGGMTQDELAQESGVDVGLIQNYEQAKSLAREETVEKLAGALGASEAAFLAVQLRDRLFEEGTDEVAVVAQLLFQIAGAYDLAPYFEGGMLGVRGDGGYIEYAMAEWADARDEMGDAVLATCEDGLSEEERAKREAAADRSTEALKRFELGYDAPFDEGDYPNRPPRLGETVKRLRKAAGMTQGQLAKKSGASVFTVRAYEQGKRAPNEEQRAVIAKALGVPVETLTDFGISNPNEAFHFLMEAAHIYYLAPRRIGDAIVLCTRNDMYMEGLPKRPSLDKLFGDWFYARVDFQETGDSDAYQYWQDHYEE